MLAQLNDCTGGLLHLGPNVITFRTLLHLGQLLHLGLQHLGLKDFFHRIQWIYIREREIHTNFNIKYLMQKKNFLKILLLLRVFSHS